MQFFPLTLSLRLCSVHRSDGTKQTMDYIFWTILVTHNHKLKSSSISERMNCTDLQLYVQIPLTEEFMRESYKNKIFAKRFIDAPAIVLRLLLCMSLDKWLFFFSQYREILYIESILCKRCSRLRLVKFNAVEHKQTGTNLLISVITAI